jgi:flagellar motility protein MotE (MotC chaperone)
VAKVATIPDAPKRRRWVSGLGIALAMVFVAGLVFLLLSFLGIINTPSFLLSLPWVKVPSEESEETELTRLQQEKMELEADLAQLSGRLKDRETEISTLQEEVASLRNQLNELTAKQDNIKAMVSIYDSMDPKAAAAILGKLSNDEVLDILSNLKKDQAAAILAALDSQKASEITRAWVKGG